MRLLFNKPAYVSSLTWLGEPVQVGQDSVLLRPAPLGLVDARGSWPYQSLPCAELISRLRHTHRPLSLTCVISPDAPDHAIDAFCAEIPSSLMLLKAHLCHRAGGMPAWQRYSARTRRRLDLAAKSLVVTREVFPDALALTTAWQNRLRDRRRIPYVSSPDHAHFRGLFELARHSDDVACFSLRWRQGGGYCGVFLAGREAVSGAWHAHTALVDDQARRAFGMYLLFDSVLSALADCDLWLGGAPSSPNGPGVYRFKQRFANDSSPAKLLYVELDPCAADQVRAKNGTYAFVPDYRDPVNEMRYASIGAVWRLNRALDSRASHA